MPLISDLRNRALHLKAETYALYLAARHPQTPWHAKLFAAGIAAYAFSPIDLIPDFVPVLGYLDDMIIIPLGITVVIRMLPPAVLAECRERARVSTGWEKPVSRVAAATVIGIWIIFAVLCYEAFGEKIC